MMCRPQAQGARLMAEKSASNGGRVGAAPAIAAASRTDKKREVRRLQATNNLHC
jgi:hypothetical protein